MNGLSLLVEGDLDETVGRCIVGHVGGEVYTVFGKKGSGYIKKKLLSFNNAAEGIPLLVIVDLMDTRNDCPLRAVGDWLPDAHQNTIFRLAVREIESWLMADREGMSQFLRVAKSKIPFNPEHVDDPKRSLVNIARRSQSARIRRLLVPAENSTATEGPAYTSEVQEFVRESWRVEVASQKAESLERCVTAVRKFFDR